MQQCTYCGQSLPAEATTCPFCGASVAPSIQEQRARKRLEEAVAEYLAQGYKITSRSPTTVALVRPKEAEGGITIVFFLLAIPITLLLLLLNRRPKEHTVVLSVTPTGEVIAKGYTLETLARDRRRNLILTVGLLVATFFLCLLILLAQQAL